MSRPVLRRRVSSYLGSPKYRLDSGDRKSQNSFEEGGHYYPNIRNSAALHPSITDIKQAEEPFDSPDGASDSGNVFTFKNESNKDVRDGDIYSITMPKSARKFSAPHKTGESKSAPLKTRRCCIIQISFLFIIIATVLGVILAFQVFHVGEEDTTTATSRTTSLPSHVLFTGELKLSYQWQEDLANLSSPLYLELSQNISSQIDLIMSNSSYSEYYYKTEILAFRLTASPGSVNMDFNILFLNGILSLDLTKIAQQISNEIRDEAEKKELPILPGTVKITAPDQQITMTPQASTKVTTAIPDLCLVVTHDACQSIGFNATILPNIFDDESLSSAVSSLGFYSQFAFDNGCPQSKMHFFCSIFLPRCEGGRPVYPCRSYCEAINQECGGSLPHDQPLDCSIYTSDNCVPEPETLITTKAPPAQCEEVTFDLCRSIGINSTVFPNVFSNNNQAEALELFNFYANDTVNSGCSQHALFFFCALMFPVCKDGLPVQPCSSLCEEVNSNCPDSLIQMDCSLLPSDVSQCVSPTPQPDVCETVTFDQCLSAGINRTVFPNIVGDANHTAAVASFNIYAMATVESGCSQNALLYLCGLMFPQCVDGVQKYPCRSLCEDVTSKCDMTLQLACTSFYDDPSQCIPAPPDVCETVTFDQCLSAGINRTVFPNIVGDTNHTAAVASFNTYAMATVESGCSQNALLYLCGLMFPQCVDGVQKYPCRSLCEDVTNDCSMELQLDCILFLEDLSQCISAPPPKPMTTLPPARCQQVGFGVCRDAGILETAFPNSFSDDTEEAAILTYSSYFENTVASNCSKNVALFACSLVIPQCNEGNILPPCRELCDDVNIKCSNDLLFLFDCMVYPQYDGLGRCVPPKVEQLDCSEGQFSCLGVAMCITNDKKCNMVNDCGDWSDEKFCDCNDFQYQCSMGMCIPLYQRCDNTTQCPDDSDEKECQCIKGQVACPDGMCIMSEWLCDGMEDCQEGWDETECNQCLVNEETCLDSTCIPASQLCDGTPNCPDRSDEKNCIMQSNDDAVIVRVEGKWYPLCSAGWQVSYGEIACSKLGHGPYTDINMQPKDSNYYAYLESDGIHMSIFGKVSLRSDCPEQTTVSVSCQARGCGKRLLDPQSTFIVEGEDALPGSYPWQAEISFAGEKHYCGGTLINQDFVLTATHCLKTLPNPVYWEVLLGATTRVTSESSHVKVDIKRIINFSDYYEDYKGNDITLLELAESVAYTPYIQPICLPESGEMFPLTSICYATGWGKKDWNGDFTDNLQELKMKLWDLEKCNSSVAWNGTIADTYMCAGYYTGIRTVCKGDSGGPLVCLDNNNVWKLVGVSSFVGTHCNQTGKPNIFTNVSQFLAWIHQNTECVFQCRNGNCLYDASFLCDTVDDCGDRSDEIDSCPVSVNCSFEEKYMCGYQASGWERKFNNQQIISSATLPGAMPQFDHTYGHYPGYYLAGKIKDHTEIYAKLLSPVFTTTGHHCLRFFYHMRGYRNTQLVVRTYSFDASGSKTVKVVLQKIIANPSDQWIMGHFELAPGKYELQFSTPDLLRVAIDDILLVPGICSESVCLPGEFSCNKTTSQEICLPQQSRCNIVQDCQEQNEESSCTGVQPYLCTFDNSVVCGLDQEMVDAGDWWVMNATTAAHRYLEPDFVDHTSGTPEGIVLLVLTKGLNPGRDVIMTQNFHFGNEEHCLTFYYQAATEADMQVSIELNGNTTVVWNNFSQKTFGWTQAQIELPAVTDVTVKYKVSGGIYSGEYKHPNIVMDDIGVMSGSCPQFVCQAGWTKCQSSDFCVPPTAICDRKVHCDDETDEANCVCTADEFTCSNGRCIHQNKICDTVLDCIDGSDEGTLCDQYRSITCDFENLFICGYSTNFTTYGWHQNSGSTNTRWTGPENDHTFGTSAGHYLYAEADRSRLGDAAYLSSPSFKTHTDQSVIFYYNMYIDPTYRIESPTFQLILETTELSTLWLHAEKTDINWHRECVDLPPNKTAIIHFVSTLSMNGLIDVDVAIDDILLQNSTCSGSSPNTNETVTIPTTQGPTCNSTQYQCRNGRCIDIHIQCDGYSDCIGGDDEVGCP